MFKNRALQLRVVKTEKADVVESKNEFDQVFVKETIKNLALASAAVLLVSFAAHTVGEVIIKSTPAK